MGLYNFGRLLLHGLAKGSTAEADTTVTTVDANHNALDVNVVQTVGGTAGLTDAELRASPVPISGTVTATGALTDTQLRASAVPVSGTFYQATQPVSGTFYQATQPVSGTFWQATQPVSGTVAVSNSFALDASVTGLQVGQNSTTSGQNGELQQGAVTTAAPSYTTGKTSPLSLTVGGALRVDASAASVTVSGPLTDTQLRATAVPVSGTVAVSNSFALDASVTGLQVAQASTTSGQSGSLVQGAVTTSAPTYTTAKTSPLSLDTSGNLRVLATGTVTATGPLTDTQLRATAVPVSGTVTSNQGGSNWSVNAAQVGGASLALGQTTASASIPVVCPSNMPLATSGGCSISRTLSANNTTGISVKGSAGQLYGLVCTNTNAAARFVKLYNVSGTPTVGTTTPVMTFLVPGNTVGAGIVVALPVGIAFATGIGLGITGLIADNDTTAPAANEVVVHVLYA